MVKQGMYVKNN